MPSRSQRCAVVALISAWVVAGPGCERKPSHQSRCALPIADNGSLGRSASLARALALPTDLLVGVGNDLLGNGFEAHAWELSPPPPLHYLYLVGLPGRGGWPEWNSGGSFIDKHVDAARARCVVPAFTLYAMASDGEGDPKTFADPAYMTDWWTGYHLALARLAATDTPALLHIEPDLLGFLQQKTSASPALIPAVVGQAVPACTDLDDTLVGWTACVQRRARTVAPKVKLGFHASTWADPSPSEVGRFLVDAGVHSGSTDSLFVETLDRDAGCFEAGTLHCTRDDGPWYWDVTNRTSPNFAEHLEVVQTLHQMTGLPLIWWQMPHGVPSLVEGGRHRRFRDNRVSYFFDHPEEFVEAGGAAVLFGPGWVGQTDLGSDGGYFDSRWSAYVAPSLP